MLRATTSACVQYRDVFFVLLCFGFAFLFGEITALFYRAKHIQVGIGFGIAFTISESRLYNCGTLSDRLLSGEA